MIPEDQSYMLRMASQSSPSEVISSSRRSLKRCASYMEDEACSSSSTEPRIWRRRLSCGDDEEAHVETSFLSDSKQKYYSSCYYDEDEFDDCYQDSTSVDPTSRSYPTLLRATSCVDPEDDQEYEERARQQEESKLERAFDFCHESRDDSDTTMLFAANAIESYPKHNVVDENSDVDDDDDDLAPWLLIKQPRCTPTIDGCRRETNMMPFKPNIVLGGGSSKTGFSWLHDDDVSYQEREIY